MRESGMSAEEVLKAASRDQPDRGKGTS
jgi:hypothetical protein